MSSFQEESTTWVSVSSNGDRSSQCFPPSTVKRFKRHLSCQWPSTSSYNTSRIYWTETSANGSVAPSTGGAWNGPFLSRATCTMASAVLQGRGSCWSQVVGLTEAVWMNECVQIMYELVLLIYTHAPKQLSTIPQSKISIFHHLQLLVYNKHLKIMLLQCNSLPWSGYYPPDIILLHLKNNNNELFKCLMWFDLLHFDLIFMCFFVWDHPI